MRAFSASLALRRFGPAWRRRTQSTPHHESVGNPLDIRRIRNSQKGFIGQPTGGRTTQPRCCERALKVNTIGWATTTFSGFRRCAAPCTHHPCSFGICAASPRCVSAACLAGARLCCGTGRAAVLPTSPDRQHAPPVPRDVPIVNRVCRWSCMALIFVYARAQTQRKRAAAAAKVSRRTPLRGRVYQAGACS